METEGEAARRDATSRTLLETEGLRHPASVFDSGDEMFYRHGSSANGCANSATPRISANATSKMEG
jgi:hypothetical protein